MQSIEDGPALNIEGVIDSMNPEPTVVSASASEIPTMPPEEFVQWAHQAILRRACSPGDCQRLAAQLDATTDGRLALLQQLLTCEEHEYHFRFRAQSAFPAGHFYSPVPSDEDVAAALRKKPAELEGEDIDLHFPEQMQLLQLLAEMYPSVPFKEQGTPGFRYRYDNGTYAHGDAIMLHLMIRWLKPRRIIEVGSGNSSCVTLDTNQHFFSNEIQCTFIEPFPAFLQSLLKPDDQIDLLPARLQEVDLAVFDTLERRDILFIDSTHVSKLNSDVNRIFFEILPRLKPGVFVHLHDIFPGFEYPEQWLREGRAWNEQYVLRAFLQYNTHFQIRLFPSFLVNSDRPWFEKNMPLVLANPGGALWMEKLDKCVPKQGPL
jgi:methyltransferase family protein